MEQKKKWVEATKNELLNGLNDENIVEKSRPLLLMKQIPFGLGELKVLDTYLSRINARNDESYTVSFSKEEYEELMGIERMHPERLSKYVDSMMGKTVTVPEENGWHKYVLFTESRCYQKETGEWWIDLSCSPQAKKLFFNIDGVGYIRYQLKNVLALSSKYSVLLYLYLIDNRFRGEWLERVDSLRQDVLRCNIECYEAFKYFKRDILDKAIREVNEKTDITFEYSTTAQGCKIGKRVVNIKFKLIKDDVKLPEITADYKEKCYSGSLAYADESLGFLAGACNYEFDEEKMKILSSMLTEIIPFYTNGSVELARFQYLSERYGELNQQSVKRRINNRFEYLRGIIKKDLI